jgi:hypothetical protein
MPILVIDFERVYNIVEEWMARRAAQCVVADSRWGREASECGEREEGVEFTPRCDVEIKIDTTKVVQYKISEGIGALDGVTI